MWTALWNWRSIGRADPGEEKPPEGDQRTLNSPSDRETPRNFCSFFLSFCFQFRIEGQNMEGERIGGEGGEITKRERGRTKINWI